MNLLARITNLYPLWLVLTAVLAFVWPGSMTWFNGQWIVAALTIVMLGMGFTLTIGDFQRLLKMPGGVSLGFALQYTVMPLSAWGIASVLQLEPGFAVGLILLGSCPGGTASNVITYLARGDLALSVVMTMASTLLAFIMTPFWCQMLAGQYVPVNALGLCLSTLQVVVAPVVIGVLCNWKYPAQVAKVSGFGPIVSVIALCLITGGVVSHSAEALAQNALTLSFAVTVLHGIGFILGYVLARFFRFQENAARTISIEVGMQNGGMAAMLAKTHFVSHPMAAVPAVFSAVIQNIIGSLLASWWRSRPVSQDQASTSHHSVSNVNPDETLIGDRIPESSTT
ncbi:MAG TPA: bile acid:sodium symporter family protein [Planctomicrobium sp.]|nr:bile acid:sodium symporter family protein [Planctomicrobium sp.]